MFTWKKMRRKRLKQVKIAHSNPFPDSFVVFRCSWHIRSVKLKVTRSCDVPSSFMWMITVWLRSKTFYFELLRLSWETSKSLRGFRSFHPRERFFSKTFQPFSLMMNCWFQFAKRNDTNCTQCLHNFTKLGKCVSFVNVKLQVVFSQN